MTSEEFQRVKQLYLDLQDLTPEEQSRALDRACAQDPQIRAEVEKLLRHEDDAPAEQVLSRFSMHIEQALGSRSGPSRDMVGQMVGPYEVIGMAGQGGMGVVYMGRDTRLSRMAALKAVLPGDAQNAARVERLRREARVLASLSHPNLATVYGLEEAHNTLFLAMEYIEGKTLSQRLGRSALPIAEALKCCEQIAAGLEAAHEAGIIHRDLKPGNVMFTADNTAKVLDFGLARELRSSRDLSRTADTRVLTLTRQGSFFGTPAYMSPEQARGEALDRRSDIFSFGAVMFRCLTGKPAFDGETDAEIIDVILTREPEWELLPANLPGSIRTILRRCLAKNPADRYRHIGDVRLDLQEALTARPWENRARSASRWKSILPWAAAIVLASGAGVGGYFWSKSSMTRVAAAVQRFDLTLPEDARQGDLERLQLALSPSGDMIATACATASGQAIWLRSHADGQWRKVEKTEEGHRPVFLPGGQWLGFFRGDYVYKQSVSGRGDPIRVYNATNWYGATWADDGTALLSPAWNTAIVKLPPNSTQSSPASRLDITRNEYSHINPYAVPGSRWVLYNAWTGGETCDIHATHLDGEQEHLVMENASTPRVVATPRGDYLLFERSSTIFAIPFDRGQARTSGREAAVAEGVLNDGTRFAAYFDVASDGTLAYFPGTSFAEESRMSYVAEDGSTIPVNTDRLSFSEPQFSADGRKLAVAIKGKVYRCLVYDLRTHTREFLLTGGDTVGHKPSPDGQHIICTVNRDGGYGIDLISLVDGRRIRRLIEAGSPDYQSDLDWSSDGKFITFTMSAREGIPRDIYILGLEEGSKPRPIVSTAAADVHGAISPDARWLAFTSEQSGRREIYIVTCPDGDRMRQISSGGGECPVWSPDGKKLYYITPQGLVSADVSPEGAVLHQPRIVYDKPFGQSDPIARNYTIAPDGRPLIIEPSESRPTVSHMHIITNWHCLLP